MPPRPRGPGIDRSTIPAGHSDEDTPNNLQPTNIIEVMYPDDGSDTMTAPLVKQTYCDGRTSPLKKFRSWY